MSLKRLSTFEDDARYRRWLATRSTPFLLALKERLKRHPDYYAGNLVTDRLFEIKCILRDREAAKEAATS